MKFGSQMRASDELLSETDCLGVSFPAFRNYRTASTASEYFMSVDFITVN